MVQPRVEPVHLRLFPGPDGWRFALLVEPDSAYGRPRGLVVYAPPFAEEMNKSRAMAARSARALASAGFAVVLVDLYGTGDSPGEFSDATWAQWRNDLGAAARWLIARHDGAGTAPLPLFLWGLRSGCLLACELAQQLACAGLLLWSPVASGRQMLQQFLRLRTAATWVAANAETDQPARPGVSVSTELTTQGWADVAGYRLSASMAQGLEQATLASPTQGCTVQWFELTHADRNTLPPAAAGTLQSWAASGLHAEGHAVVGPSFWRATEIEVAADLVTRTCSVLEHLPRPIPAGALATSAAPAAADSPCDAEVPVRFDADGTSLVGILTLPAHDATSHGVARVGVVIVVGGPQVRAGSHRQFTQLARALGSLSWPVLRFDLRGMGDSDGEPGDFTRASPDIAAAINTLLARVPGLDGVVLWGLCDGASAALMYVQQTRDERVRGIAMVNPWVRSAEGLARVHVKHYYLQRLRERAFWAKLVKGGVGLSAVKDLASSLRTLGRRRSRRTPGTELPFQERMLLGAESFMGPRWLALSGRDLTAHEFVEHTARSPRWQRALAADRCSRIDLPMADHTFSGVADMDRLHEAFMAWLNVHWPRQPSPRQTSSGRQESCLV